MFWRRKPETSETKVNKLKGPKLIPDIVGGHLVTDFKQDPDVIWKYKVVLRQRGEGKDAFDVRVFDDIEAATKKIKIEDYDSFDAHPELILYEGWFDKEAIQVQLEEKRTT